MLCALGAGLSWRLGYRSGAEESAEAVRREIAASGEAEERASAMRSAEREAQLAAAIHERDTARATIEALRDELDALARLDADERAELELYRRVGGESLPSGLSIESVERTRGRARTLAVTLVQARGRDRVSGRVYVLPEVPGGSPRSSVEARRGPPEEAIASERFDLRFFETVELPLRLAGKPLPDGLIVSVVPDSGRHEPFEMRVESGAIQFAD